MMRGCFVIAGLLLAQPLHAQGQVVIYRCTDANGALTVQNDVACPKGSKQERRIIDVPPPMPVYRAAAPQPKPAPQTPPETIADVYKAHTPEIVASEPKPPPALFECKTFEGDDYFSDNGDTLRRCIPMQIVGLDGSLNPGAGESCEVVSDTCKPVSDESLCQSWDRRVREAEFRWKFTQSDERDARKAEYERLAKTLRDSNCKP